MASSSKDILSLVPSGKKAPNVAAEKIDERILRLLGIEAFEVEMDYDTYKDALREFMARGRASKTEIPGEETERITNEWKRVKSKKGRFKTKVKKIKAENIKSGGGVGAKTTTVSAQKLLPGTAEKKNPLQGIKDSVDNIAKHFKEKNKQDKKQSEEEQKAAKRSRREKLLGGLKKGAEVIAKGADKILTPVKNVFQKILEFFIKMFLARALIKVLGWFSDPENKKKVDAIFRFLGDHWPKLLALYLRFGTGLGRFIGFIGKKLARGAVMLTAAAARMVAAKAGGRVAKFAGGLAGGLSGGQGKLVTALASTALTTAATMATSSAIDKNFNQGSQKFAGGGLARLPAFAGGGMFGGLGKLMGGAGLGAMFGPLGMLLGGGLGALGGFVSGEEGPDKVPAMLTAGEFVMSKGAVEKYGVAQLESMNAAGGGTNKPKMKSGTTFAQGGGHIEKNESDTSVVHRPPSGDGRSKTKVASQNQGTSSGAKKILQGAKAILGMGNAVGDQCANTTRAALKAAGNSAANKVTQIGDLDTPKGTAYNAPSFAASFGGSDMGQVITNKNNIKAGDIILWRMSQDRGGNLNKGAIAHVGISADDGMNMIYDHSTRGGFQHRPFWDNYAGRSWFAGIRLGGSGGTAPATVGEGGTGGGGTSGGGSTSTSSSSQPKISNKQLVSMLDSEFSSSGPSGDGREKLSGLPTELGGGGGGTNSLTEQAKVKTWWSAITDFLSGDDGKSRWSHDNEDWMKKERKELEFALEQDKKNIPTAPLVSTVNLSSRSGSKKSPSGIPAVTPDSSGASTGVPKFNASSGSKERKRLAIRMQIA